MSKPIPAKKSLVGTRYNPDGPAIPTSRAPEVPKITPERCGVCLHENFTHADGCPHEFVPIVKPEDAERAAARAAHAAGLRDESLSFLARSTAAAILRRVARWVEPDRDRL
jgi:hypothetical protein